MPARYSAPAAACAADLLKLVNDSPRPLSVADVARELGASKSLVYRVTCELEARGFLRRTQDLHYRLGLTALELGSSSEQRAGFAGPARAVLRELVEATGANANLAVLRGMEVLYILRVERPDAAVTATQAGSRLPAHCTALGKVLLAQLADDDLDARLAGEHTRLTARSKATAAALRADLARTRRRGFAISREEAFRGRACLALPVAVRGLAEPAAISVSTSVDAFDDRQRRLLEDLVAARARLQGGVDQSNAPRVIQV
jgi:DNA-binding IclR family transcriptional regulator